VALVAGPLLVILAGGAYVTTQAVEQLRQAQDAQKVATTMLESNRLSQALENELLSTLTLYQNPAKGTAIRLNNARAETDRAYAALRRSESDEPRGGWDGRTRLYFKNVADSQTQLGKVRTRLYKNGVDPAAFAGNNPPRPGYVLPTLQLDFSNVFGQPRGLTSQLANVLTTATSDGRAVNTASVIASLSDATSEAADEIVDVNIALSGAQGDQGRQLQIQNSIIRQQALLKLAKTHATPQQQQAIDALSQNDQWISGFRQEALGSLIIGTPSATGKSDAVLFTTAAGQRLANLDELVNSVTGDTQAQASQDERDAFVRLALVGGGALLLILVVTLFTAAVARSVSVPLRRLRSAAVETTNLRLPAAVQQIEREGPEAGVVLPPALPPGQEGGPETSEVAQAFDGLTNEAVHLAAAQVRLRRSLDDAFVSMSRRSQSMVEKQLAIIDELERTEEDPDQLRNLFRLDHLAARMRRYNDNLLVLAGSVVRTRSNAPVPIADVFRAATSEMEQYERVRLQPVSGAAIAGPAAGGLIHLLAELLDNAAMYSPPTSPILMAAAYTPDGGLRLEITDSGVGIPGSELAELNGRLASPGNFHMQVPSRMGLYVVARLAQRGGFGIQLAQRVGAAGTVAEVVVPPPLVIGAGAPVAEAPRTPESLPQVGAAPAGPRGAAPLRPLPVGTMPTSPAAGIAVAPPADQPGAVPAAADDDEPLETVDAPEAAEADEEPERTTARLPRRSRGEIPVPPAPAASTPAADVTEAPARPLPSRRPGAALAGGPLAAGPRGAGAGTGSVAPLSPIGPSPFATSAAAGPSGSTGRSPAGAAASGNGVANGVAAGNGTPADHGAQVGNGAAARAGGGFGVPGRPFTAGVPASGRRAGAGGPSAATAAAAAAAARAARSGGGGSSTASALFTARGPADGDTSGQIPAVPANGASNGGSSPAQDADATTGPVSGAPHAVPEPAVPEPAVPEPAVPEPAVPEHEAPEHVPADRGPAEPPQESREQADGQRPEPVTPAGLPVLDELPLEMAASAAAAQAGAEAGTPIYDTVSMWFSSEVRTGDTDRVIDLRDRPDAPAPVVGAASRWSSLGDQRWLATNARAAAGPEVAGTTEVGLPRRRPGANLIPSAAAAAPVTAPATRADAPRRTTPGGFGGGRPGDPTGRADADAVRGRLSSYQRGLTSARRARHLPADRAGDGLFTAPRSGENDPGRTPGEQGG
jgi:signal transduction histidine kinase